jgi:hypothetical protein
MIYFLTRLLHFKIYNKFENLIVCFFNVDLDYDFIIMKLNNYLDKK